MRVVVADPPADTPPYDRSLCGALARAGAEVELVTSRFRFGAVAEPEGYEAREWFYPLSSRMGGTRLRLAAHSAAGQDPPAWRMTYLPSIGVRAVTSAWTR